MISLRQHCLFYDCIRASSLNFAFTLSILILNNRPITAIIAYGRNHREGELSIQQRIAKRSDGGAHGYSTGDGNCTNADFGVLDQSC